MNYLPAVLLFLGYSPSHVLYITNYFYKDLGLAFIHKNNFAKCMELIDQTKSLLKSLDLEIYLVREDILQSILIKWFTSYFCTILNGQEVSFFYSQILKYKLIFR